MKQSQEILGRTYEAHFHLHRVASRCRNSYNLQTYFYAYFYHRKLPDITWRFLHTVVTWHIWLCGYLT